MKIKQTFLIKGTYYYDALKAYQQEKLHSGQSLLAQAEPDNPIDSQAIQLFTENQELLGYVPKILRHLFLPYLPFLTFSLTQIRLKGQYLALYCQVEGQIPLLRALQIYFINIYLYWQYRLKYRFKFRENLHDRL